MTTDPFDLIPPGNPQRATQSEIGPMSSRPITDDITDDDDESNATSPA
jgi:hypothetical protein